MIDLYWGRGTLDTLNNYLEKKLNSLPGKSDRSIVRKLNGLIKRIRDNEACLTHAPIPLSKCVRFITSCFQIQKLSVDLGEDEQTVRHELKSVLGFARGRFAQLNASNPETESSFIQIKQLKRIDKIFFYQTLAKWIDIQKIPIQKLDLPSRELQRLAPHLTYLNFSGGAKEFSEKQIGDLLSRTTRLRHLSISNCSITGEALTQLKNVHRFKFLEIGCCFELVDLHPQSMPALKELWIKRCPKLNVQSCLDFLMTTYMVDKERALKFAKTMKLGHLAIWGRLYQDSDTIENLEFLIQRLTHKESAKLLESMMPFEPFEAQELLSFPKQFVVALLRTEAGREVITSKLTDLLNDANLLALLQTAYPPGPPENLLFYPIKTELHDDVLQLTMIPTMARDYPDHVVQALLRSSCDKIKIFHYGSAVNNQRDLTTEFFVELFQGSIYRKTTKLNHGHWTISAYGLGRIIGLALRSGCPIGDVFDMEFMHCLRLMHLKMTLDELVKWKLHFDLLGFIKAFAPPNHQLNLVESILTSKDKKRIKADAKKLNIQWQNNDLKAAIKSGDLNQINDSVRTIGSDEFDSYIEFAQEVAKGMESYLPFEIKKMNGSTIQINEWLDFDHVTTEEFAMQLQGRGMMMKAFVQNPAYRGFVQENIKSFLEEPGMLPVLCATYPPGKPENLFIYPIRANILNRIFYLKMIPTMPQLYPDLVFDLLAGNRANFDHLSIGHYGSAVVDRGGPKNQFFSDLMQGIIRSSNKFRFEKTANGKLILVAHPMWSQKGQYCTNSLIHYSLGAVIGLALRFGCPIGEVFCKEFIHCLRSFSKADLELEPRKMTPDEFFSRKSNKDLIAYMKESVPPSTEIGFVEKVLLSEKQEDICVAARDLNECWLDEGLSKAIDYGDIFRIKRIVRSNWLEGYKSYIHTVHSFAVGLMTSLPFEININDERKLTIREWDDLAFVTTDDLALRLQGKLTVEWIKNYLEFKPNLSPEAENVKMWINQWFDDHEDEDEVLANVIQTLTGARAVTSKITFQLTPHIKGFYVHTCFQTVDVPQDVDEEGIRAVLDSYGRGEHLQFNRS